MQRARMVCHHQAGKTITQIAALVQIVDAEITAGARASPGGGPRPSGVSLRRQRHMFRGYYSPDGSNWPLAGWDAIHLPNRVFVV
jgi:hypothetical protein